MIELLFSVIDTCILYLLCTLDIAHVCFSWSKNPTVYVGQKCNSFLNKKFCYKRASSSFMSHHGVKRKLNQVV